MRIYRNKIPQWVKKKNHLLLTCLRVTLSCSIFSFWLSCPFKYVIKKAFSFLVEFLIVL